MSEAEVITRGFPQMIRRLEAKQQELKDRRSRAGQASARAIGLMMKVEAPRSSVPGKRKHLRSTIKVRHTPEGDFAVGPKSPLAHLVIRGAARGQTETVSTAKALSWADGTAFAHSAVPGPMPANDFVSRVRQMAEGPARDTAGAVLFHDAPDPPDPEGD